MNFKNFLKSIDNLQLIKKHAGRNNTLCSIEMDDLFHVPYWSLKHTIPDLLKDEKIEEAIHAVLLSKKNITFEKIRRSSNYEKAKFFFWLLDQYEKINELERVQLTSASDPDLTAAGVSRLNVLEDFNMIDNVAKSYRYTHEEVKLLPYETIFSIQLKEKLEREINKKLSSIKRKKRNNK